MYNGITQSILQSPVINTEFNFLVQNNNNFQADNSLVNKSHCNTLLFSNII